MDELGISEHLVWLDSNTGFFADGRIWPLTGATDLIKLGFIPLIDRVRIGLVTLYLQRITAAGGKWHKFERVTAWEWLRRAVGQRAFERVWGAQLRAKFGPRAEQVAMTWFWNKIFLRTQSRARPAGAGATRLHHGQLQRADRPAGGGGPRAGRGIRAGVGVNALERHDGRPRFTVRGADGRDERPNRAGDHSVARAAAPRARYAGAVSRQLTAAVYQGAVWMLLQLSRPLSSTYWLNIGDERIDFTGIIEHTNLIGPEHYGGATLRLRQQIRGLDASLRRAERRGTTGQLHAQAATDQPRL